VKVERGDQMLVEGVTQGRHQDVTDVVFLAPFVVYLGGTMDARGIGLAGLGVRMRTVLGRLCIVERLGRNARREHFHSVAMET
jgi:hypothetical protein